MKDLFRVVIYLVIVLSFIACGPSVTATLLPAPSPIPPTITAPLIAPTTPASNGLAARETARVGTVVALQTASTTPLPSQLPTNTPTPSLTATLGPTSRPEYVLPTLIPTIDPMVVSDLLRDAFSIQTLEGMNGHKMRQITGWDYGFGANIWYANCPSHVWLDTNHLLLYPGAGQEYPPEGMGVSGINIVPQPVVMNLETGSVWLPPVDVSSGRTCNRLYWSRDLGVLINSGIYKGTPAVFTHTFDGKKVATYRGVFTQVSPSKEKVIIDNHTIIDLRTNSRTTLAWSLDGYQEQVLSEVFWTSDETRLYRCCYFYADLTTGTSHRFGTSDFQDKNGRFFDYSGLWMYRGQWVRNDTYFLVEWSWVDDGDIRYLPLFDPATRKFYDVREMAGISEDWHCHQTTVSPDGMYVWMTGWEDKEEGNYLVNLSTFESHYFPGKEYLHIDWSPNSKFAWMYYLDPTNSTEQSHILSVADKEIWTLPVNPLSESNHWWHGIDDVLIYQSEDKNTLIFLNVSTMTHQELPLILEKPPHHRNSDLNWSPNGEKIALVAADKSLWQVDYPNLENLEQLTPSLSDVSNVNWSPDSNSIAFISGSDIYVVDTIK